MRWDIGIDLGTQNVRLAEARRGPILSASAALAFREGRQAPICVGDIAERLVGRTCEGVSIQYPLQDGALQNNYYAQRLFRWLYHQSPSVGPKRHFNAIITCAPFVRPVQREAMLAAALEAGASEAMLVRSDVAAAVGAGMNFQAPEAKLLIDVGAGKMTATLFTYGRVAAFESLPFGFNRIDDRIRSVLRTEYGYRVGKSASMEIKHTLGSAMPERAARDVLMHTIGISTARRLPVQLDVETQPVLDACESVVSELTRMCASVVEQAPEELSADLNDSGALLVGGGALMTDLSRRIGGALGIPCRAVDDPANCAVRGLVRIMQNADAYQGMTWDRQARSVWR